MPVQGVVGYSDQQVTSDRRWKVASALHAAGLHVREGWLTSEQLLELFGCSQYKSIHSLASQGTDYAASVLARVTAPKPVRLDMRATLHRPDGGLL
jgi:hypothetical protein